MPKAAVILLLALAACTSAEGPPSSPSMARVECMRFLGGPLCVEKCQHR